MATRTVWVVEMWNDAYYSVAPRWEPTVGMSLTKKAAREKLAQWRSANPDDKFRVVAYDRRPERTRR